MKHFLPIIALFFIIGFTYAQVRISPDATTETGFLYDFSYQFSGMEQYDGSEISPVVNNSKWNQLYFELSESAITPDRLKPLSQIKKHTKQLSRNGGIPFGVMFFEYNFLTEQQKQEIRSDGTIDISLIAPEKSTLMAATAFNESTRNGNNVVFYFDKDLIFAPQDAGNLIFAVDFGDGSGWRNLEPGDEMAVNYSTEGTKIISLKIDDNSGKSFYSKFKIEVIALETPAPDATWSISADLSYNDVSASGDVYVLYGNGNTKLTNPVVISEGIDFDDENNWEALYELLNQQNLLEDLRSQGFDVLVLNFNDAVTYIQSNAFLMVKLIEMVNDSIDFADNIIVVGPSMGGLVTRYALTYMENNGMDHNCNLWISFEAPHQGANLPLGLQYQMLFFKDLDANIQLLLDVLNQPAPRQMLVYRYTDPPSSPANHDNMFSLFQNELSTIGSYPQIPRKAALSNGRGDAIGQPYNAGAQVILYNYNTFLLKIKGNVWAVQNNASGLIFEGLMQPLFGTTTQMNVNVFSSKPFDNSPGGINSTFADIAELEAPFGDIIALHPNHSFIPTVSGLDIDTQNLFYNLANNPDIMDLTPFDTIYWAADNYEHKYISPQLSAFIVGEVLNSKVKTQQIVLNQGWNDLSTYLEPAINNLEELTAQLGEDLIILQHFGEIYWPEQGINLIGEWDFSKGYVIKVSAPQTLTVQGTKPSNQSIIVTEGWNLIPVLSNQPVELLTLLGNNLQYTSIIKDGVGLNVFWPAAGIQTLQFLHPGNAYYIHATDAFEIIFNP